METDVPADFSERDSFVAREKEDVPSRLASLRTGKFYRQFSTQVTLAGFWFEHAPSVDTWLNLLQSGSGRESAMWFLKDIVTGWF